MASAVIGQIIVLSQALTSSLAHHDVVLAFCLGLLLLAGCLKLLEELIRIVRGLAVVLAVVLALSLLVGH